jgi:hypothetical protein
MTDRKHLNFSLRILLRMWLVLSCSIPSLSAWADERATLPADGIPFQFEAHGRIVAIGDIHGNFDGMLTILRNRQLVDVAGEWIGGNAHVVFLGDLNGKGKDTRLVMDFIIRLSEQAHASGGMVHSLIGNHEARHISGDLSTTTRGEVADFQDFEPTDRAEVLYEMEKFKGAKRSEVAFVSAIQGETKYAKWFRQRNQYIRIGNAETGYFGFVHAGLRRWMSGREAEINSTTRRWIEYYQGVGPKPPKSTHWTLVSENSPSWDTRLPTEDLKSKHIDDILSGFGIKNLIIGHQPTSSGNIETIYDAKIVMADTGIHIHSEAEALAAVEIADGKINPVNDIARRVETRARPRVMARRSPCSILEWDLLPL